jgi:GNAT superfamily N-acetyltransferase
MRRYRSEADYRAMRSLLQESLIANGLRQFSWHVSRLDYWRWHVVAIVDAFDGFEDQVLLWEAGGGLVGFVVPDGPGEAYLNVLPSAASAGLDREMLAAAEQHLAVETGDVRRIVAWSDSGDLRRRGVLTGAGYARRGAAERQGRCRPSPQALRPPLPPGFAVRPLRVPDDLEARSWASWRAFHPSDADDRYQGADWYLPKITRQPLYRPDLDLVVAAPDGRVASFTTIWLDERSNTACFEAVGTAPEFQRRGLAKALPAEGLARLAALGVERAFVGDYREAACSLYAAAGFIDADWSEPWLKECAPGG